jgi:hypothetical protein
MELWIVPLASLDGTIFVANESDAAWFGCLA